MDSGKLGFSWITEILNSRYQDQSREWMAGRVVQLLGRHFFPTEWAPHISLEPTWIPPLLGFLSLGDKSESREPSGLIALRILAATRGSADFGPMVLSVLHSTLLPTDRLHARCLALDVFFKFVAGWFSPEMKNIPSKDLNKLVQAVDDPFQFANLPGIRDAKLVYGPNHRPMMVTAVLIEFASSDLWRNHLCRSNFTSCEEFLSTWDGKKAALMFMSDMASSFPQFLSTATRIDVAIKRLEELQCPNTVEVVITWGWSVGAVDPMDHVGWQLIERDTLRFYQIHGVERLTVLKRFIVDRRATFPNEKRIELGLDTFSELPVQKDLGTVYSDHFYGILSAACLLRRLYRLFGYDPTTWEAIAVGAGGKVEVSGHSVVLAPLMDWACDYP